MQMKSVLEDLIITGIPKTTKAFSELKPTELSRLSLDVYTSFGTSYFAFLENGKMWATAAACIRCDGAKIQKNLQKM